MKKIISLSVVWIALIQPAFSQSLWKNYSFSWSRSKTDSQPSLVTGIPRDKYGTILSGRHPIIDSLSKATVFWSRRPDHYYWTENYDSSTAAFFMEGALPENYDQYEFRVLVDGVKEKSPWTRVSGKMELVATPSGDGKKMYLLGRYNAPTGSFLAVDLRRVGSDSIISATIAIWPYAQPLVSKVYVPGDLNLFFERLGEPFRIYDSAVIMPPAHLIFKPLDNNLVFYLNGNISAKDQLEYQLIRDGGTYSDWKANEFDKPFIWLRNLPPGDYQLKIRYSIQRQHISNYQFRVEAAWHQTSAFKIILGSLAAPFFGCIALLIRVRRQKRSFIQEKQKKEMTEIELRAIRSQLNPHFIFNALSSIQGLMNQSEIERANQYLSRFSLLMRNVLDGAGRENNHLYEEIRILENYLFLQQLRFNFSYSVTTAPEINPFEVEIPALLIQPLAENSVIHGVSALGRSGHIDICFARRANDMIAYIQDNGRGFDPGKSTDGYGLALTRRRIALINEMSHGRFVSMEIDNTKGTSIRLIFKNWLA